MISLVRSRFDRRFDCGSIIDPTSEPWVNNFFRFNDWTDFENIQNYTLWSMSKAHNWDSLFPSWDGLRRWARLKSIVNFDPHLFSMLAHESWLVSYWTLNLGLYMGLISWLRSMPCLVFILKIGPRIKLQMALYCLIVI